MEKRDRKTIGIKAIKRIVAGSALLWALFPVSNTHASLILIDFESLPVGSIAGDTVTINAGGIDVTFAGLGLRVRQFNAPFPNSRVLSTQSDFQPITVTFETGFETDFVQIENIINGTYTSEVDIISGIARDALDAVVDNQTNSNTLHQLSGAGIVKVVYDDVNSTGYVIDNFTFQVPEPATLVLMGLGLAGIGWRRKTSSS